MIPFLLAFAFILYSLWGPYINQARTYSNAFLQILQLTIGKIDPNEYIKQSSTLAAVVIFLLIIFVFYFIFMGLLGIFTESFRMTILAEGRPKFGFTVQAKTFKEWILQILLKNAKPVKIDKKL